MDPILVPAPKEIKELGATIEMPRCVWIISNEGCDSAAMSLASDLRAVCGARIEESAEYTISLEIRHQAMPAEGYRLEVGESVAYISAEDAAGLWWGCQTLVQLCAMSSGRIPCVRIKDWPHYRTRSVMLDMGRAPYSAALIKRVIRIMSRLKLNSLHLHLFDDHLNAIRFKSLPLGSENPFALSIEDYAEIIRYARERNISVVPEFECWGHAGSILYHYPNLYGAPGMWEGFSFGIGEELYDLLARMFDEFVPILEDECVFHVGLDEANWATLPSVSEADKDRYTPTEHVRKLHEILSSIGEKHGKTIRMRLWADHGGRPIPEELKDKVIVEPWMYFEGRAEAIRQKVAAYSGEGKTPFMMGGGMSQLHYQGHCGATRIWCKEAMNSPNCEGINICVWESNNVPGKMIGIFGGADSAWSPDKPDPKPEDLHSEWSGGKLVQLMRRWQSIFADADPAALEQDRGPEVQSGKYCWPPFAGVPVAPTCTLVDPRTVDAFHEDQHQATE